MLHVYCTLRYDVIVWHRVGVQVINLLNTDELMVLLVNELITPRTFYVKPTQVMYVSGLGRIDYVQVCDAFVFRFGARM